MRKYKFPESFRPASLDERFNFYNREVRIDKAINWLLKFSPFQMSITLDLGEESGIIKAPIDKNNIFIRLGPVSHNELKDLFLEYLPEDVYYDRTLYLNSIECHDCQKRSKYDCVDCKNAAGQELVFDIDPENFNCPNCDRAVKNRQFSFCMMCFNAGREATICLYEILKKQFSHLQIVFTGRGFHIHVLDKEAFFLSSKERRELTSAIRKIGIGIDSFVPIGQMYLVRLPYTLNGLVSRVVTPLTLDNMRIFKHAKFAPTYLKMGMSEAE